MRFLLVVMVSAMMSQDREQTHCKGKMKFNQMELQVLVEANKNIGELQRRNLSMARWRDKRRGTKEKSAYKTAANKTDGAAGREAY